MAVYLLPGADQLKASEGIYEAMRHAKEFFPSDMDYKIVYDTTPAVKASIESIVHTFVEAVILVTLVVFIFLQNLRATFIPLLTVPVSLIGTFIFFPLLGFSVNTLSMFGLVLAIGIVVDDAIVVVEAVMHHIEQGMSPRDATVQAMKEVSGPVIGIALILTAVFIPVAFIPGLTGRMYQQFALTIAISVILSAFSALSLSPALSAMLLKPAKPAKGLLGRFFGGFNRVFERVTNGYLHGARLLVRRSIFTIVIIAAVAVGAGLFGGALPAGFIPEEDQGILGINVTLPPASSLERTSAVLSQSRGDFEQDGGHRCILDDRRIRFGHKHLPAQFWNGLRPAQAVGRTEGATDARTRAHGPAAGPGRPDPRRDYFSHLTFPQSRVSAPRPDIIFFYRTGAGV
jgi:HAE1 family hydrophobic/amphiphilic exporter-1